MNPAMINLKSISLIVLTAVLAFHEANGQACTISFATGAFDYFTCSAIRQCVDDEINALAQCIQQHDYTVHVYLNDLINELRVEQNKIKKDVACLKSCGKPCPIDDMCYAKGEKVRFSTAEEECNDLEDDSLISTAPSPDVIENCLHLDVGDTIWLNRNPSPSGTDCTVLKIGAGYTTTEATENCTDSNTYRVCKITLA